MFADTQPISTEIGVEISGVDGRSLTDPRAAERCRELGGEVVDGPRMMGRHHFCVVRDPAGAVIGLVSEGE